MTSTCVTSSTTKGRATPLKGVTGPYGKTTPTMWYGSTQDCDACAWPTRHLGERGRNGRWGRVDGGRPSRLQAPLSRLRRRFSARYARDRVYPCSPPIIRATYKRSAPCLSSEPAVDGNVSSQPREPSALQQRPRRQRVHGSGQH